MLSASKIDPKEPLLVSSSLDINGSVFNDTVVRENCSLHVRGNLLGSLTIEPGATVIVEGSVDGKIIDRGGRLVVNNKGLAAYVTFDGPPEAEACGVLKINLTAIASNWERLSKYTEAECASVVKQNLCSAPCRLPRPACEEGRGHRDSLRFNAIVPAKGGRDLIEAREPKSGSHLRPSGLDPVRRGGRFVVALARLRPVRRRRDVADRNGNDAVEIPDREGVVRDVLAEPGDRVLVALVIVGPDVEI